MHTAPILRMPHQSAGIDRRCAAAGATAGGGVEAAIIPELLLAAQLLANPQGTIDSIGETLGQIGEGVSSVWHSIFG